MITDGTVALIPIEAVMKIVSDRPTIAIAIWRTTLIEAAVFRQWIANVGRRNARTRIAHLLCEFATRSKIAGLGDDRSYVLPMSQDQLADAVSLTPIHVNRTLRQLANEGLVELGRRSIKILNWDGLVAAGDFDPAYLIPSPVELMPKRPHDEG
jgi:CRP-like cAMP-binding protein